MPSRLWLVPLQQPALCEPLKAALPLKSLQPLGGPLRRVPPYQAQPDERPSL
jgi:hypothetical protein